MKSQYSTREAAEKLGIALVTLQGHAKRGTVTAPPVAKVGGITVRLWTDADLKVVRKELASIKPGRKKKIVEDSHKEKRHAKRRQNR